VFEVPVNNIEDVKRLVEETMVRAGDEVLGGGIPVEVEMMVGEVWRKA
jgi:DNA polymerase I-like protein with 3'-5' exonuclease and polymerase domains